MASPHSILPIETQYYSGSQASIFIGDVYIDEAVAIQYSVQQQKTPIYGYASQLFDTVAPGPVLVQGSLTINYVEAGYLWAVLSRYRRLSKAIETSLGDRLTPKFLLDNDAFVAQIISGTASEGERLSALQYIITELASGSGDSLSLKTFQDRIWGAPSQAEARRVDDNKFDDVEIFVAHGDVTDQSARSSVRRILGVHFLSTSQETNPTGDPVLESYQFLGRDVE